MADESIEAVFRREAGRVLGTLIRLVGDFELAEESLQEAFAAALEQWPQNGPPNNPRAWLIHVGRRKGIDRLRRLILQRRTLRDLEGDAENELRQRAESTGPEDEIGDDLLRLIFTCCHPALSLESQVALTLRAVCGLSTQAVARAFLISPESMAQRLVRTQRKIRLARIPYETPALTMLDQRLDGVLAVIYLVFTEGYAGSAGAFLMHAELADEAVRLARVVDSLLPGRAAVLGLLALMLLHRARNPARATADGDIILLEQQDRALWNQALIAEGLALVERALRLPGRPSGYAVQAAIAALHAQAARYQDTDWPQIAALYAVLLRIQPSPVIELNHAAAISMVDGPAQALQLVEALIARRELEGYHLLPTVHAELLLRLGRREQAREQYRDALVLTKLEPERRLIMNRLEQLQSGVR
ncbi:MAG TPA: sigma-70 family RNA polymerase sigma factor [Steroidobacteraceae bacterium]|jgi:RNA polymerase sigma-70 factor (ECF subfamily)